MMKITNVDFISHQAALRSVPASLNNPYEYYDVNVMAHHLLNECALKNKVQRVVCASSSSVYGCNTTMPQRETNYPMPISPYAVSKLAGEKINKMFWELYGLDSVSLRYANVYGPAMCLTGSYATALPIFYNRLKKNLSPLIFGHGLARDLTFVENVVSANILSMTANKPLKGEPLNIACGKSIAIPYVADKMAELMGKKIKHKVTKPRLGDVKKTQADISKARRMIKYKPIVHFDEGLKRTLEWFERQ